jgi:hypothetical protein
MLESICWKSELLPTGSAVGHIVKPLRLYSTERTDILTSMASLIRRATAIRENLLRQNASDTDAVVPVDEKDRKTPRNSSFPVLIHVVSLVVIAGGALLFVLFSQFGKTGNATGLDGETAQEAENLPISIQASTVQEIAETRTEQALASDILETFSFRLAQISSAAASGEFDTARADMQSLRREMAAFGEQNEPINKLIAAQVSTIEALKTLIAASETLRAEDQERIAAQAVIEYTRSLEARTRLGESLLQAGNVVEAENSFKAALGQLPALELAHIRLLELALAEHELAASVETSAKSAD